MKIINKVKIPLFLVAVFLTGCNGFTPSPALGPTSAMETFESFAMTSIVGTQMAIPTATPMPPVPTSTPTFSATEPTALPSTPPTPVSPYEADHEEIRKVIAAYFDKAYSMHNSFQVDGLGDTISTSEETNGFLRTELRKRAVDIVWARQNYLRYASYEYTLDYSEIVVFDAGQRARANFTEGNGIVYELSIPSGIESHMSGVNHIMNLKKEQDGWKIIYDVRIEQPVKVYRPLRTPPL